MENGLDAGARAVTCRVVQGGRELVEVVDDAAIYCIAQPDPLMTVLGGPQQILIDETLQLPKNYEIEAPEDRELDSTQGRLSLDWKAQGRKLRLTGECAMLNRTIPADEYAGLHEVVDAMEEEADAIRYAVRD